MASDQAAALQRLYADLADAVKHECEFVEVETVALQTLREENEGLRQRVKYTEAFETLRHERDIALEAAQSLRASHAAALTAIEGERRTVAERDRWKARAEDAEGRIGNALA